MTEDPRPLNCTKRVPYTDPRPLKKAIEELAKCGYKVLSKQKSSGSSAGLKSVIGPMLDIIFESVDATPEEIEYWRENRARLGI